MNEKDQRLVEEINNAFLKGNSIETKEDEDSNYVLYEVAIRKLSSLTERLQMFPGAVVSNRALNGGVAIAGQKEKCISMAEVRMVLAKKADAGYIAEVKDLLRRRGVNNLAAIDSADYPALLADAESL